MVLGEAALGPYHFFQASTNLEFYDTFLNNLTGICAVPVMTG
jgi:hypothetical protein